MASVFCTGESPHDYLSIHFYLDGENMPPNWANYQELENGEITHNGQLCLPIDQYSWVVNMLQNNSPVYALLYKDTPDQIYLQTINQTIRENQRPRENP